MVKNLIYKLKHLKRIDFIILLLTILFCTPIYLTTFFATVDGPSHLYSALILKEIILSTGSIYHETCSVNYHLFPNWSGHVALAILQTIFSASFSEKLFLTLLIFLFVYGIRSIIIALNPSNKYLTLFVFPFIYNVNLMWGFYNFLLGFGLSLFAISVIIRYFRNTIPPKFSSIKIILLFWLIYFSHPIPFVISSLSFVLFFIENSLSKKLDRNKLFTLIISVLPPTILLLLFILKQSSSQAEYSIALLKNIEYLIHIYTIHFQGEQEGFLRWVLSGILFFTAISIIVTRNKSGRKTNFVSFLFLTIFCILLYLFFPEVFAGGSIIRPRIGLYLFSFVIILFSFFQLPAISKYIVYASIMLSLLILFQRTDFILTIEKGTNSVLEMSDELNEGDVITPVYLKELQDINGKQIKTYLNVFKQVSNYLAIHTGSLDLLNYEMYTKGNKNYFPVKWKNKYYPYKKIANYFYDDNEVLFDVSEYEKISGLEISYVLVFGDVSPEEREDFFAKLSKEYYEKSFSKNKLVKLFTKNP